MVATGRYRRPPYFATAALAASQLSSAVGAVFWSTLNCGHGWKLYLQFAALSFGVYATRINTALLAAALLAMKIK